MEAPWSNRKTLRTEDKMERLSKEILSFEKFISPTKKEQVNRDTLLYTVTQIVNMLYPGTTVSPFGSYATGLLFPTSDIDVCVNFDYELRKNKIVNNLFRLKSAFLNRDIFNKRDINVVGRARIPVMTAVDENKVSIDITMQSQPLSSDRTIIWLREYPELKPLFMVLKQSLSGFRLAYDPRLEPMSAKNCGLASYSLICLIVSFLQMQTKNINKTKPDYYAQLLLRFLQFYSTFNYEELVISLKDGGKYYTPDNAPRSFNAKPNMLNIIDPDMPEMNVARSTSKFGSITDIFRYMSEYLNKRIENSSEGSILSAIINMPKYRYNDDGPRDQGADFSVETIYAGSDSQPRRKRDKPAFTSRYLQPPRDEPDVGFTHPSRRIKKANRSRPAPYQSRPFYHQYTQNDLPYDDNNNDNTRRNGYQREYERHKSNGRSHLAQHYKRKADRY